MNNIIIILRLAISLLIASQTGTMQQQQSALSIAKSAVSMAVQYQNSQVLKGQNDSFSSVVNPSYNKTMFIEANETSTLMQAAPADLQIVSSTPSYQDVQLDSLLKKFEAPLVQVSDYSVNTKLQNGETDYQLNGNRNVLLRFAKMGDPIDVTLNGETKQTDYQVEFQNVVPGDYVVQLQLIKDGKKGSLSYSISVK